MEGAEPKKGDEGVEGGKEEAVGERREGGGGRRKGGRKRAMVELYSHTCCDSVCYIPFLRYLYCSHMLIIVWS